MAKAKDIGQSQSFVIGRGCRQVRGHTALIGHDNSLRFFLELSANPDNRAARPELAYREILSSMQPGWVLRLLRFSWPDPAPRQQFLDQVGNWGVPGHDGLRLLQEGLVLHAETARLPFIRRTVLELAIFESVLGEALAWWESAPHLLGGYGVAARFLHENDITTLTAWLLNPKLEG